MAERNSSGRNERELFDAITAGVHQLEAMLVITYGDPDGQFHRMNDDLRDRYLWACADKIAAVREALDELTDDRLRKRGLLPKAKGGAA